MNWIPVTERLPEYNTLILAFYTNANHRGILVGTLSNTGEWNGNIVGFIPTGKSTDTQSTVYFPTAGRVTHWMPLPKSPEPEEV